MIEDFPAPWSPGSNAIGSFEIGVSPIGTISPFQWQSTVISQYANSARIIALIKFFDSWLDQTEMLDEFYDNMWNILTAIGYGLDVWGRIVGVSRTLEVTTGGYFGFAQGAPGVEPWGNGVWYTGEPISGAYALTDDAYRLLILAKAAFNICDGSIPAINSLLMNLFGDSGDCWVSDDGAMSLTYHFAFHLSPVQEAIVGQSGILPTPCGVTPSIVSM